MYKVAAIELATVKSKGKGQSLIEVVVGLGIMVIVLGALLTLIVLGLKNSQNALAKTQITKVAQDSLEQIRTIRDNNIPIVSISGFSSNIGFADAIREIGPGLCADENNACYFWLMPDLVLEQKSNDTKQTVEGTNYTRIYKIWKTGSSGYQVMVEVTIDSSDQSGAKSERFNTILSAEI